MTSRNHHGPPEGGEGTGRVAVVVSGADLDRAEVGPGRGRLTGQVPVQGLVAWVGEVNVAIW